MNKEEFIFWLKEQRNGFDEPKFKTSFSNSEDFWIINENGPFSYKDCMEDQVNLNIDETVIFISDKIQDEIREFTYEEFINTNLDKLE